MGYNNRCWYYGCCKKANTRDCTAYCVKYLEMLTMFEKSNLPKKWWKPISLIANEDVKAFERLSEIKSHIVDFVNSGCNIYIYSQNYGNGKTSWAVKLLSAYFDKTWYGNGFKCKGLFIDSTQFLTRKKGLITKIDEQYLALEKMAQNVNLAVWDDISACKLTDYDFQTLYTPINSRMFSGKSNIFTGAADRQQLEYYLGSTLASKIWNNCEIIEFKNLDMRGVL